MEQQAEDVAVAVETGSAPAHPLDPCTGDELAQAVAVLRDSGSLGEQAFFTAGYAAEPPKDVVREFEPGAAWDRLIRLVGHDRERGQSFDARVSLTEGRVAEFTWVEDGQANIGADDYIALLKTLWSNEEWIAAVKKRGIEDLSLVHIEPWVAGVRHPDLPENARVIHAIAFLHADRADNYYARPLEGLSAHADCDSGQVVVEDHGVVPMPTDPAEYAADRVDRLREGLKPIEITQPEGPSFEVEGNVVRWQKWQLRVSMQPTEGLVLHDIRYDDDGRDRPILYRAALSDMVVPYGDTSPMHGWKHAFDGGEAALGHAANSLVNGCDCLGEIHYFDNFVLQGNGEPRHVPNAICLHEEDFGILWKHTNVFTQHPKPEVRRSRRLVVSSIVTLGNYEYGFYWYFYLDGTIQVEIKLTGMVGVSVVEDNADSDMAPIIAESIASPIHQHIFCFRLDFNLDGPNNSVYELEVEPLPPGADNPYGSAFRSVASKLGTESEAQREVDPARSRHWRVVNEGVRNHLGKPVGYKLLPQGSSTMYAPEDSLHAQRGGFARHNLWVTPYAPGELDAAGGVFTNLHSGAGGLAAYAAANRSIEDTDVVVWHTLGVTHVPRPEDWPVMPVEYAGFTLMPTGFFDRNPSLDVPPTKACHT